MQTSTEKYILNLIATNKVQGEHRAKAVAMIAKDRKVSRGSANRFLTKKYPQFKTKVLTQKTETPIDRIRNSGEKYDPDFLPRQSIKIQKDIDKRAEDYVDFLKGTYLPLEELLKNYKPELAFKPIAKEFISPPTKNGRKFVATAFDWHIGGFAEKALTLSGKEWNMKEAKRLVHEYTEFIAAQAANDKVGFDGCIVLMGGDLYHTLSGYTARGTLIQTEVKDYTQFKCIMDLLIMFTFRMHQIFGNVEVHYVRGNHGGIMDIPLGFAVGNMFHENKHIKFEVYPGRHACIRHNSTLIILDHGASDVVKQGKIPKSEGAIENHINRVLGQIPPEQMIGVKHRYLVCGDKHHFKHFEFANFELIQCGALPLADSYAEACNLHSKSRQNCFVLDGKNGITQTMHCTFE